MPLKPAFSNSDNVFSTVKLVFKRLVNIKVFEQKAEVTFWHACFIISRKVFSLSSLLPQKNWVLVCI